MSTTPNALLTNKKVTLCSFCCRSSAWVIKLSGPCREFTQQMPLCSWDCAASLATEMFQYKRAKQAKYLELIEMCQREVGQPVITSRPANRDKPAGHLYSVTQYIQEDPKRIAGLTPSTRITGKGAKQGVPLAKALVKAGMVVQAMMFPLNEELAGSMEMPFQFADWQDMFLQNKTCRRIQLIRIPSEPSILLIDDGGGYDINHRASDQLAGLAGGPNVYGKLYGNVMQINYNGQVQT